MKRIGCQCASEQEWSRRDFVKVGSLGFLGMHLSQSLLLQQAVAARTGNAPGGKAKSVIVIWLEGGPSQKDTFDPKPSSAFRPISTNVPGIQVSELLPQIAKRMDKLSIIRSMRSFGDDHPQATHYAATGHELNPAMKFPSWGSIVGKELGPTNALPPYVFVPSWDNKKQYEDYFRSAFLGPDYDPMMIPDPAKDGFEVADLSLPKSLAPAAMSERMEFQKVIDRMYRSRVESLEHAAMDSFTQKAWEMILAPEVRHAFDLSQESEKTKDTYGRDTVGLSLLLSRRLVESGVRFVTAAGYHGNSWDTHSKNDAGHRDRLCPPLDKSLSTLIDDLVDRGLYDSTVVVAMGGVRPHAGAQSRLSAVTIGRIAGRFYWEAAVSREGVSWAPAMSAGHTSLTGA